ncbi:MAG: translesion error-prone DNA polymerase V subunit UmuC [SAR86 cluster bacterium]|uniref:Translesion error-prone DNA polymerase V subunit UmuC n=1 Tax=SAR86 cluster bacterium TaxID=2030880 RepID=A0A520MS69_9GAMM|nr:MAG: translesion error-prone DNA polymerase V subunit UmuC [SAR86 cluster bacterium]
MFALIDCNSFYASCEKIFRPDLKDRPVVILSNNDGCVIARSSEAKKMGVSMTQPWYQVKDQYLSKGGVVFSSNYELYADISNRVMNVLSDLCPEIDIYSIDEAFLDLRSFKKNIDLVNFSYDCKRKIREWVGIPVSIGIAPTKTLAKLANKVAKDDPRFDGVVILSEPKIIRHFLRSMPVEKIWGIGKRLTARLENIGVKTAYDLTKIDSRLIGDNFNVVLERTVRELKGQSCITLHDFMEPKKQIMVSRSFGRSIRSKNLLSEAISFHASRAAEKLRYEKQKCRLITTFIRSNRFNTKVKQIYASRSLELIHPTDDTRIIIKSANRILEKIYANGYQYAKAGILLSDFTDSYGYQMSLFDKKRDEKSASKLMETIDYINLMEIAKVGFGNQGYRNTWKMKREVKSQRYTTKIDEIPIIK